MLVNDVRQFAYLELVTNPGQNLHALARAVAGEYGLDPNTVLFALEHTDFKKLTLRQGERLFTKLP